MNTLNYQQRVLTLEEMRDTAQAELETAMDQLIASTLQTWSRLDQIIASKKNVAQAKWRQMRGLEGQMQAKDREIESLRLEIQDIREIEIPAKQKRIAALKEESSENYKQHQLLMSEHDRMTGPFAMFLTFFGSLLSLGRVGQNTAKAVNDLQRQMANLKRRRTAIAEENLPSLEKDITTLNRRIQILGDRVELIKATADTIAGKRDEYAAEIKDILGRSVTQLEDQRRNPHDLQLHDRRIDQLKSSIEGVNEEISHLLGLRRAEIIAQARLMRRLISAPGTDDWDQIEVLLLELRFIQAHHP